MWAYLIIFPSPLFYQDLSFFKSREDFPVQKLIPHAQRLTCLKKLIQFCIGTLQHRSPYPLTAIQSTLTKPTKPFILGYSVIAIVLLSSVPRQSLVICLLSNTTGFLKARGKGIDGGIVEGVQSLPAP